MGSFGLLTDDDDVLICCWSMVEIHSSSLVGVVCQKDCFKNGGGRKSQSVRKAVRTEFPGSVARPVTNQLHRIASQPGRDEGLE